VFLTTTNPEEDQDGIVAGAYNTLDDPTLEDNLL